MPGQRVAKSVGCHVPQPNRCVITRNCQHLPIRTETQTSALLIYAGVKRGTRDAGLHIPQPNLAICVVAIDERLLI